MAKLDIYSNRWTEIIFDNKNKTYGAYDLRKIYAKNVGLACIIAVVIFSLGVSAPKIAELFSGDKLGDIKFCHVLLGLGS